MHESVRAWGETVLTAELCAGKLIMEVGSYNVNGSLREYATRHNPAMYVGVDMQYGPGVDIVCEAEYVDDIFLDQVDLIICTEMMEHCRDWYGAFSAMHFALKLGGTLLLTTRSPGFPYHGYPDDWWRFTKDGMAHIMDAFGFLGTIIDDPDPNSPGVMCLVHSARPMAAHIGRDDLERYVIRMEQPEERRQDEHRA